MSSVSAVGPTPAIIASSAASANLAVELMPELGQDFPALAIGALIDQCCGNDANIASAGEAQDVAMASVPNLADHGITRG